MRICVNMKNTNKFLPICETCKKTINQDEFIQFEDCQENHYYHKRCIKQFEKCTNVMIKK